MSNKLKKENLTPVETLKFNLNYTGSEGIR